MVQIFHYIHAFHLSIMVYFYIYGHLYLFIIALISLFILYNGVQQ